MESFVWRTLEKCRRQDAKRRAQLPGCHGFADNGLLHEGGLANCMQAIPERDRFFQGASTGDCIVAPDRLA